MSLVSSINSVKRKINPAIIIEDGALLIEARKDGIFKFDSFTKSGKVMIQDSKVIIEDENGDLIPFNIEDINHINSLVLLRLLEILDLENENYDLINMNIFFSRHTSNSSSSINKGLEQLRNDMYFFLDSDGLDPTIFDGYHSHLNGPIFTTLQPLRKLINLVETNKSIISKSEKLSICILNPNLEVVELSGFKKLDEEEKEDAIENNIGINYLCIGDPVTIEDELLRAPRLGVKGFLKTKLDERDYDEFMLRIFPMLEGNMSKNITNMVIPFNRKGNPTNQFSCYIKKTRNPFNKRHNPKEFKERQIQNSDDLKKILSKKDVVSIQKQIKSTDDFHLFSVDVKNNYFSWKNEPIPHSVIREPELIRALSKIKTHSSS